MPHSLFQYIRKGKGEPIQRYIIATAFQVNEFLREFVKLGWRNEKLKVELY
jgi:hypothetical protein